MKILIFWIVEKYYEADYKKWKEEQADENKHLSYFLKKYWRNDKHTYDDVTQCPDGCGRTIRGCRCIDKAFGY